MHTIIYAARNAHLKHSSHVVVASGSHQRSPSSLGLRLGGGGRDNSDPRACVCVCEQEVEEEVEVEEVCVCVCVSTLRERERKTSIRRGKQRQREGTVEMAAAAAAPYVPPPPGPPITDFDSVDLDSLELPPGYDMGIESDGEEEREAARAAEEDAAESLKAAEEAARAASACMIVVRNLPVVSNEKYGKLCAVLRKIFNQVGTVRENGLTVPVDESTGMTRGFGFVEFMSEKEASVSRTKIEGYKLDKQHVLSVMSLDEVQRILSLPNEFVPPAEPTYKTHDGLLSWLMDDRGRDQFMIRFQDQTEVLWNDAKLGKCESVYSRAFWTESFVQWSPRGQMLATVHRQGAAVWGGPDFGRLQRFSHPFVRLIGFSPGEKYIVTYSSQESKKTGTTVTLSVFDVKTGQKLRSFVAPVEEFSVPPPAPPTAANQAPAPPPPAQGQIQWPLLRWSGSGEDRFVAKIMKNTISVYEAPDMHLLDKKSIKLENVQDFLWSPSDEIFAAYQGERGDQPAKISIIGVPSKKELRQKNLFNVSDVKMYWHPQGEYLAAKVDRHTKSRKTIYTGFELFSTKEKDVPMEVLEMEKKEDKSTDKVIAFAWESKGSRFAMIHGDGSRPDISFYTMKDKGGKMKFITTLKSKPANALYWSPTGRFIVLAGLKGLNGQLEFFDCDELTTMSTAEHFMCTDVEWDPTGRYVATSVTSIHQMENGFTVWDFKGKMLYKSPRDRFFQFLWRPRHPSLLTKEKQAEILKDLKKYQKRYDEEDEARREAQDNEQLGERRALEDSWNSWLAGKRAEVEAERDAYLALIGESRARRHEELEFELETVEVEEFIDVKEEVVPESELETL